MKFLIVSSLLMAGAIAQADIPRPGVPTANISIGKIDGVAASALWESLKSKEIRGSALRTSSSSYKVLRAEDGLDQVVCERTVFTLKNNSSVECFTETSLDGKELKEFKPHIRLG
jgi:hypothetical protein